MKRRWVPLTVAVLAALVVAGVIAALVIPRPGANYQESVQVAQNAGVPAGVTPGPP